MTSSQLYFIIVVCILCGCHTDSRKENVEISPSFYHWKTEFSPTQSEWSVVHQHKVKEIYLRFFDVAWDATYNKPTPIAQVRIADKNIFSKAKINIIPTIFITNECIKNIRPEQCRPLAENIYKLITGIVSVNNIDSIPEIQIDCDWTGSTKEKYFSILTELQKIDKEHLYSATIRLFQVKYKNEAGIPPVKKGLLMCYNMGNLKDPATGNSVLDPKDLKKYIADLPDYPLQLDVALPLFSWYVLFRQNVYKGLTQQAGQKIPHISKQIGVNRFQIINDTMLNEITLKKGDVLRYENSSFEDILKSAQIIKDKLHGKKFRLSLYHLDSITLSKYSAHEMEAIFRSLN